MGKNHSFNDLLSSHNFIAFWVNQTKRPQEFPIQTDISDPNSTLNQIPQSNKKNCSNSSSNTANQNKNQLSGLRFPRFNISSKNLNHKNARARARAHTPPQPPPAYLSDMVAMVLKASINPRSGLEPRFCHRPSDDDKNSPVAPLGLAITVERPPSARSGFVGPPTRTGSLSPDSLAKVLHSEVSSMEWDSSTRPHSEQTVSPAEWSKTTSVCRLQSEQKASDIAVEIPPIRGCLAGVKVRESERGGGSLLVSL